MPDLFTQLSCLPETLSSVEGALGAALGKGDQLAGSPSRTSIVVDGEVVPITGSRMVVVDGVLHL